MEELEKEESGKIKESKTAGAVEDLEEAQQISIVDMVRVIMEYLTAMMCAAIFIVIPLYMKNGYYGIGTAKYDVYRRILFICIPFLVCFGILYLFFRRMEFGKGGSKEPISLVDRAVLFYLLCVFLSFFLSDFKSWAIWGYEGWYMGLISQISFVLLYFFISRFGKMWKGLLSLLCCVSFVVFVLGVLNRFLIDPLDVYVGIDSKYQIEFLSTLGQSSWYSSFICTVLPIGIYFFFRADTLRKGVLSGIYCVVGFSTLVTQNSDSAYIALACILLVLFCVSVKSGAKMTRFYWITLFFLLSTRLMNLCAHIFNNQVIEQLETLSYFLIMSPVLWGLLAANVLLLLVHKLLERGNLYSKKAGSVIRNIFLGAVVMGLLLSILCLYLSGTGKLPESVARITTRIPYLTWNDMWGNRRGFSWRVTWQMFQEMNLVDKLFGVGPECYPYYAYSRYKEVLDTMFDGLILSNAHNEWYNAMINYGVIGGGAYLGIFLAALRNYGRNLSDESILVGVVLALSAYVGHNIFCYQQVLCTPFVFCILGVGEYYSRQNVGNKPER